MVSRRRTLWDGESQKNDGLADNPAAPSNHRSNTRSKWARRGLFVMAFVATPLTFLIWINAAVNPAPTPKPATSASSTAVNSSAGKAPAIEAIREWLASTPAPLPGGRMVSWNGYKTLAQAPANKDGSPAYSVEIHYFTLSSGAGDSTLYFASSVEVHVDPILGAKVSGEPTLLPMAPTNTTDWQSETTWQGYTSIQPPKPVSDAVDAWAEAFTSGKPQALRLAVGDPNPKHAYMPLTGASASSISITAAAGIPEADPKAQPKRMLVRVTFQLAWSETVAPNQALPTVTYDLLVTAADTASPRVVSWGGPGSAPSLKPYSTAVNGKTIQGAAPTTAPTTTPDATDSTNGQSTTDGSLGHD